MSVKKVSRAFDFFIQSRIEEDKRQNKDDYKNFSKHCAQTWKTMPEAEKKKFQIMEECDEKRYNIEMKRKKIKRKELLRAVKLPKSGLFFYKESIRAEIKSVSAAAERYRELSEEQRQPFLDLAALDQQRYRREKKQMLDEIKKQKKEELKKIKGKARKKAVHKVKPDNIKICSKEFLSESDSD